MTIDAFQAMVWEYYAQHARRDLPWRRFDQDGNLDPYHVLVSEIMLQQTQVPRVIPKFEAFVAAFPAIEDVASASLADVLRMWSGLGYNRRAKFLWQAAAEVVSQYKGCLPDNKQALVTLSGIGPNTAGAILAYAYNQPVVFIETNIRSVYIHHFFAHVEAVDDKEIISLVAASLPESHAREWYWALMDYGTHIKQTIGNTARTSKHYTKQPAFHGSRRKVRGQVLKLLAVGETDISALEKAVADERLQSVLKDLEKEGFISQEGLHYSLRA